MSHKCVFRKWAIALVLVGVSALALPGTGVQAGGASHAQKNTSRSKVGEGGQAHARRESVRTRNAVSRTRGGVYQKVQPAREQLPMRIRSGGVARTRPGQAPARAIPKTIQNQRTFTKTGQGRRYDNGLVLRKGAKITEDWQRHYFPRGHVHFPYYRSTFVAGASFRSPFGFYFGVCVPYVDIRVCHAFPPAVLFVDVPIYSGQNCQGFYNADDGNLINDPTLDQTEPGLNNALDEIVETFQGGNIDGLVSLIDPNMSVAVYERGQYQYSLSSNDFVDMTRDAIQSTQTISLDLQYLHRRSPGVYCVSGRHVYKDPSDRTRTVFVSYVLQDIGGQWTLTQVGTSPDMDQDQ
ncbi:MAG: hypothetical protein P4L46_00980 [Fimbriimonas sp.]|nr:hypothetical protein [Fimbriimonas sp.]